MAKYVEVSTGIVYEPSVDYVEEQFASDERFEAVRDEEPKKATRRRTAKPSE